MYRLQPSVSPQVQVRLHFYLSFSFDLVLHLSPPVPVEAAVAPLADVGIVFEYPYCIMHHNLYRTEGVSSQGW